MLEVPWEHFDAYYQSTCIPLQQYSPGLLIDNKQTSQAVFSYSAIQSHKAIAGINSFSTNRRGTMIKCQNKFSDSKKTKKKSTAVIQKKYLSVDKMH